ncbi:MAG TPA: DUF354 domain-containing protein [Methanoregulaceae archaeon]|nr:DUF354 domain-containing protein [Methanoregulaceae archaeon]HQJ87667.1 DUF354 domain-containing protein [Methanoregulaceae archaeon]
MRIVVDINHPAHVHYFKHFVAKMQERGHEVLITASEKEISYRLLDLLGFEYRRLGSYGTTVPQKALNLLRLDYRMYRAVRGFAPDLFVGFGSIRAAHVATLMRRPYIALDDSEPSPFEHLLYVPFADAVLTPSSFRKDLGANHRRFESYVELSYLHPRYFEPDPGVLDEIGESEGSFALLRFVAWQAVHDVARRGFSLEDKIRLVRELERHTRVYISSESPLPSGLEPYRIAISPEKIHHVLYYARLFVGDSQTMSTEAALLGTPAVRCNSFVGENDMGNFIELEQKYGLLRNVAESDAAIGTAVELITDPSSRKTWRQNRERLLRDKIDLTRFLVWFTETYPDSMDRINDYQDV